MKNKQIKEITSKAIEQLSEALNEAQSETLTRYLRAIGCFIDLFRRSLCGSRCIASRRDCDRDDSNFTYRPSPNTRTLLPSTHNGRASRKSLLSRPLPSAPAAET